MYGKVEKVWVDKAFEPRTLSCRLRGWLLWGDGLYSLTGWLKQESPAQIRQRAAAAYDRYQHCGVQAASRLLVTAW